MLVDEGGHVMMLEEVRAAQASGGAWKGFHERAVFAVMNMAQHGALIDVLKGQFGIGGVHVLAEAPRIVR